MNKKLKLVLTLAIIAGLSGLILTTVNSITDPIIVEKQKELTNEIVISFYPEMTNIEVEEITDSAINNKISVYQNEDLIGYVYDVSGANGYGSITSLVAVDLENNIIGIDFSEFAQTPGFGDKLLTDEYLGQYSNLDINDPTVDGVSGATFSSKLVADEVKQVADYHLGGNNE